MRASGASGQTSSLVRDTHRASTWGDYASHWKAWLLRYGIHTADPTRPSHVPLPNHPTEAALAGGLVSAAALRVRRSAILSTCRQIRPERAIALHMSSDVIRAVALRRAKTMAGAPAWDLRLVLESLTSRAFEPPESRSLRALTWKTVFLVMQPSGRRASEAHGLSGIPSAILHKCDRSFHLNFLPKFLAKSPSPKTRTRLSSDSGAGRCRRPTLPRPGSESLTKQN